MTDSGLTGQSDDEYLQQPSTAFNVVFAGVNFPMMPPAKDIAFSSSTFIIG